jgi:uncharacterized SAM-binding protein YcdF (DUF218 family)
LGIVGIVLFIWSLLPLLLFRILGLGNMTGIVVGLLLLLFAVFFTGLKKHIRQLTTSKYGRVYKYVITIIYVLIVSIVFLVLVISGFMIHAGSKTPGETDTVIVLGCQVSGENPSLMLQERLEAAKKYLLGNPESVAVLSGGKGPGEDISEAECMRRFLTANGISEDRLYLEDQSTSTRENMQFSKDIIEEQHLSTNVAIVTNEFHEYRASKIAKKAELNPSAISAKTHASLFFTFYVRELYGVLFEWLM